MAKSNFENDVIKWRRAPTRVCVLLKKASNQKIFWKRLPLKRHPLSRYEIGFVLKRLNNRH